MRALDRVVPVLVLLLPAGCPATTAGSMARSDVPATDVPATEVPATDVPATEVPATDLPATDLPATGPCRWSVGEAVVLEPVGGPSAHRSLLDARPAEGGVWVLVSDDAGTSREPDTVLERLDVRGRRRGGSPVRFPSGFAPARASLAVDDALGLRAVLQEAPGGTDRCALVRLDATGRPSPPRAIVHPGGGFSLEGCLDLLANRAGYTFLAAQIRALWGVSMVQLDPAGATPAQDGPGILTEFPEVPYGRFGFSDRSFALAWTSLRAGMGRAPVLQVRRFDEVGDPRGEAQAVQATTGTFRRFVVLEARGGMVALWEEASGGAAGAYRLALRDLDAAGAPRGEAQVLADAASYQGGFAGTVAQRELLVGFVQGSGVQRPVVFLPVGEGVGREGPRALPVPAGTTRIEALRLVTTPAGALAVFSTEPGAFPNRLVAVPLTCER